MRRPALSSVLLVVALGCCAGCSFLKPKSDPTKYYVLTALPEAPPAQAARASIGVQHISLPDYLVRPELVTRRSSNELQVAEYERWGEPLKDGFERTLRRDLSVLLGDGRVIESPWDAAHPPDLILDVDVRRFERGSDGAAELEAGWSLHDGRTGAVVMSRAAHVREPIAGGGGGGGDAAVAALSRAVASLARQIADAVRSSRT
jgi:uncharacterized protein